MTTKTTKTTKTISTTYRRNEIGDRLDAESSRVLDAAFSAFSPGHKSARIFFSQDAYSAEAAVGGVSSSAPFAPLQVIGPKGRIAIVALSRDAIGWRITEVRAGEPLGVHDNARSIPDLASIPGVVWRMQIAIARRRVSDAFKSLIWDSSDANAIAVAATIREVRAYLGTLGFSVVEINEDILGA